MVKAFLVFKATVNPPLPRHATLRKYCVTREMNGFKATYAAVSLYCHMKRNFFK